MFAFGDEMGARRTGTLMFLIERSLARAGAEAEAGGASAVGPRGRGALDDAVRGGGASGCISEKKSLAMV